MFLIGYKNLKNIKIRENFESDASLAPELIMDLIKIRAMNPERFNMLLKSKILVFTDINALKTDAEYFSILKSYDDKLKNTTYISEQSQLNLAKAWTNTQEILTQLEIREIALSSIKDDPLQQEIIAKLISSNRKFKSVEHFNYEVTFRLNAVRLMSNEKIHSLNGNYQYPTPEANYLQLNEQYWQKTINSVGFFKLKAGVKPSDAIDSIFDETTKVVLECHSMMMSIQYKALLDTIGAHKFNLLFKNRPLVIADGFTLADKYNTDLLEILPITYGLKKETLIPGDWIYLSNFSEYSLATLYDDSKDGNGLHSMVMGNEKYRGFGSPLMTEEEAKLHFLEIYNEDFCAFPIKLTPENIDDRTMGLDCNEDDLKIGDKALINGHISCPEQQWQYVECIYNGNGKFTCDKLMMNNATEDEITLALLEKYNLLLPKRKTVDDLKNLKIFISVTNNAKGISFSSDRFHFLFQPDVGLKFFDIEKKPAVDAVNAPGHIESYKTTVF